MKYLALLSIAVLLLGLGGVAVAQVEREAAHLATPGTEKTLTLPEAANHAAVIDLGEAVDPQTGEVVHGYAIPRYAEGPAKPSGVGKKPGSGGGACYGFLAKGAKWKTVEPWIVNPQNPDNLDAIFVLTTVADDVAEWQDAADGTLDGSAVAIMGSGEATTTVLVADSVAPDGQNEVLFGTINDSNTIAVTIVWGVFYGPPSGRYFAEWDQVYNTFYRWSATGAPDAMDFDNIVTHELGHSFGLADLYDSGCSEATMYGYGMEGETKKQTLEAGDITGISELYQ